MRLIDKRRQIALVVAIRRRRALAVALLLAEAPSFWRTERLEAPEAVVFLDSLDGISHRGQIQEDVSAHQGELL